MKTFITLLFLILGWGTVSAQETAHLHFDKQSYLPGDTVFFKAYLYYAGMPSFLSTNFYVAAYSDDGELLLQKQYPVFDGTCNGDIALPDTLHSHGLRVRAYTRGLVADDSTRFYEQRLEILQQQQVQLRRSAPEGSRISIFAEGRHVLAGRQNTFAVTAKDQNDFPLQISGVVTDETNRDTVAHFATGKAGLAKFSFVPESGKSYTAYYSDWPGHPQRSQRLPETELYGALLHMEKSGHYLYCNIYKRINGPQYDALQLTAYTSRQQVYGVSASLNGNDQWICKINTDSLPGGQLRFVLADKEGHELASRLFFNQPKTNEPEVIFVKKNLQPKGENLLEIRTRDSLFYNLSVSVTDAGLVDARQGSNIQEDFLAGQNRHSLLSPAGSLLAPENKEDLDAYMIVTGSLAPPVRSNRFTKALDNFLAVTARYNEKYGTIPENNQLTLVLADTVMGRRFYKLPAADKTSFREEGMLFFDSARCSFQVDLNKTQTENVRLERVAGFTIPEKIEPLAYVAGDTGALATTGHPSPQGRDELYYRFAAGSPGKIGDIVMMKPVVVRARVRNPEQARIEELDREYTSGMFSGLTRGYQFNLIDDKNAAAYSDIYSYILYRFNGLFICHDDVTLQRTLRYKSVSSTSGTVPPCRDPNTLVRIFLNELELPDPADAGRIPVSQIAYIKLINGVIINSSFSHYGVVLYVYTKKDSRADVTDFIPMRKQKLKGYDIPLNFSVPDYSNKMNQGLPDKRTTLFWEPYLILNQQHPAVQFTFSNNDVSKRLLLTLEGFDEDGRLIHIEKIIE